MNEERKAAAEQLLSFKPMVVAQQKAAQSSWTIYGEEVHFDVNGTQKRAMFYSSGKEDAPVYFDIHGGGFAWGTIVDGNFYCQKLAQELGMNVYSLEYPLSPENYYPSQLEELEETISFILAHPAQFHICPDAPAIGGRSAGGNLAAALCIRMKDVHFRFQVLDHPWLDLAGVIPRSERYITQGFNLVDALVGMAAVYADADQRRGADISPILADKATLAAVPPAVIQTCALDGLRNDGDRYAQLLREAGVPVIHHVVEGAEHGFSEADTEQGAQGRAWLIEAIRSLTAGSAC